MFDSEYHDVTDQTLSIRRALRHLLYSLHRLLPLTATGSFLPTAVSIRTGRECVCKIKWSITMWCCHYTCIAFPFTKNTFQGLNFLFGILGTKPKASYIRSSHCLSYSHRLCHPQYMRDHIQRSQNTGTNQSSSCLWAVLGGISTVPSSYLL